MTGIKSRETGSVVVAKAGLWYTVCNFMFRGMAFITTPIFTRLLSKTELGTFSNFSSWISILAVVTSFDLSQSVIRSKLEHEDDMDSYIWSILAFSTLWTALLYLAACLFPGPFTALFHVDKRYIHVVFPYLLAAPAYNMLITKHRAYYKYKTFVVITGIVTVSATLLSLTMVLLMQNKLAGRILGFYLPHIAISAVIYIFLAARGRKIKIEYWKYACVICLPLVPHTLSLYLLSSSDKIIITNLCGAEYTAVYSVAYSAYHIVTILMDSMNKAWAPWLMESLHLKKYDEIRKISKIYIGIFIVLMIGILLLIPEIIWFFGGKKYAGAVYCLPPLICSCAFQLIYRLYVNVEFFKKKTFGVSAATLVATLLNIALNFLLIPLNTKYCYVIAAYTTLIGYIVLFFLHYVIVRRMKMDHVYEIRYILLVLAGVLVVSFAMNFFYRLTLVRYIIVLIYGAAVLLTGYKYRNTILAIFKKK